MDALTDNYVRYYNLQKGGRLPVFYGQDGQGVGDVLKGAVGKLLPYMFPIAKGSVNDFLDTTEKLLADGKSGTDVLTSALKAGFKGGLKSAKNKFLENSVLPPSAEAALEGEKQSGSGRRRKRRRTSQKGGRRRKRTRIGKHRKVYKRAHKKSKRKRSTRKLAFKTNF